MGSCALLVSLAIVLGACGQQAAPERTSKGAHSGGIEPLIAKLSAAGPQGSVTPKQAASTAKRQTRLVRDYADHVTSSACKSALGKLASAYEDFARAASTQDPASTTYSAAAQQVSTSLQAAEAACNTAG